MYFGMNYKSSILTNIYFYFMNSVYNIYFYIIESFYSFYIWFLSKNKKNITYKNNLLQYPSDYFIGYEDIKSIDINNQLVITIRDFIEKHNLYDNGIIVSLSGGVDSMVIMAILLRLRIEKQFNIYVFSINYNLRKESKEESEFLKTYCNNHNIIINVHNINGAHMEGNNKRSITNEKISGGRKIFEETSRNVRYNGYKELMKNYKCKGVMVGHHKDDIIENIFTNSMKGYDIMNIEVMKYASNINDVNIYRPLLDFRKKEIYKLAHKYNIPYFLDTTPEWSRRGKMRNDIFPLFDNVFGKSWKKKYKEIGTQSNDWNRTIDKYFVKPWLDNVFYVDQGFTFQPKYMEDKNLWIYIIPKMFFKMNVSTIKRRSIIRMYDNIYNNHHINKNINLDSGFKYIFDGNKITIFKN